MPVPTVNNYCSGRKALQFLKDEKYECIVKIGDLEMLHIMKSLEEHTVISATPLSMNSSVLVLHYFIIIINYSIKTINHSISRFRVY